MDVEMIRDYCLSKKQVTEGFPFDDNTLVFKVAGKMFALCDISSWESGANGINLKCDPEWALELRDEYENIKPGFHMNKVHWNTVTYDATEMTPSLLMKLIDHSYELVVKGLPKKVRDSIV
ncbi:MmcQ/YjbR family DNA-binding protein [Joostella sp.]|uniref:MmcQ/YjbR family DNA-binding protein n=1 Tax=Joostella sp. TaxID=2231138 RepID=UPI003A8EC6CB